MRIGFFTYGMKAELTGIGRYTTELTYALRRIEPSLEIILLNPYPESTLQWYREFPTYPVPLLQRLPNVIVWGSWVLARAATDLRLNILHDPCGIAPFIALRHGIRRVVTVHDAIPYVHPELQPFLTRIVFQTLIRASKWTSDAVVTVSDDARSGLIRYVGFSPNQISVTHSGALIPSDGQVARWRQLVPGVTKSLNIGTPYFLYVGAINPRKNVARLLQAFRKVHERKPDVHLVIVGPQTEWPKEMLFYASKLEGAIHVTGFLDDEVLHVLYVGAIGVVYPSLYEGFGSPALEGMAHGTAVITSNVSSLPEVVGDSGILIDPIDADAIACAMLNVLDNPSLLKTLQDRGRKRAKQFTFENTARETLKVYRRILGA